MPVEWCDIVQDRAKQTRNYVDTKIETAWKAE